MSIYRDGTVLTFQAKILDITMKILPLQQSLSLEARTSKFP